MKLDVLVFAAHPDDAELSMGGTIAKLSKNNFKVGIIDLTMGELGTRGTPETRQKEAAKASVILKVATRENLFIPDGDIQISRKNIIKVIKAIRKYKPKIIFAPYFNDRHPDHFDASGLIKRGVFQSGLKAIKTIENKVELGVHRPGHLYYYMQTYTFEPSFIIDISDYFELKMKAVKAYSSQFFNPKSKEPETFISRPNFMHYVDSRALYYGFQIGKSYGEPFYSEEKIELDLFSLLKK
ncbi:MAG TPA: bacillithiol biosynthesis deacetylase BshB1 [Ignavibacteriaceae bacterium]|nr:bacillithiol biosynthesis deacetylase BshB1 [Ignavibacteriaceae bacterium]